MYPMDFYISTCRCVMQANPEYPETYAEIYRLIPCLRQSLGCYVCFNILQDPMGPTHNVCKHSVCRKCLGGKMKLKPACSWCKDHWFFEPNSLLKILVTCFKKLCMYILSSPLGNNIVNSSVNGQSNNVYNILREAAGLDEDCIGSTSHSQAVFKLNNLESGKDVVSFRDKPGCSSDDDHHQIHSGSQAEDSVQSRKNGDEISDTNKSLYGSNKINGVKTTRLGKQNSKNKKIGKTVVFFKRASENKNKRNKIIRTFKKKAVKQSLTKKQTLSVNKHRPTFKDKQDDAPCDLEKMDIAEPSFKKVKQELPPPELKPLTSCKCGKSGTTNQLTCLGQRCQCYSMKLPCIGCKCKGCRNPKKGPDSSSYPTSGLYGASYLRSGSRSFQERVCVNM